MARYWKEMFCRLLEVIRACKKSSCLCLAPSLEQHVSRAARGSWLLAGDPSDSSLFPADTPQGEGERSLSRVRERNVTAERWRSAHGSQGITVPAPCPLEQGATALCHWPTARVSWLPGPLLAWAPTRGFGSGRGLGAAASSPASGSQSSWDSALPLPLPVPHK